MLQQLLLSPSVTQKTNIASSTVARYRLDSRVISRSDENKINCWGPNADLPTSHARLSRATTHVRSASIRLTLSELPSDEPR
ncbi:hypothetical protein Sjap_015839 [Stephania japonica]|uniref:Uncharacterized protein n=1 Tax=Stephania japonica TaxID=461633 RepID=A0AAP0IK61_9MAGN